MPDACRPSLHEIYLLVNSWIVGNPASAPVAMRRGLQWPPLRSAESPWSCRRWRENAAELDEGFRPPGNSDPLGAMPDSMNPFFSMWANGDAEDTFRRASCARTGDHSSLGHSYLHDVRSLLRFEEHIKGSVEKGKLADLIVVSDDPLTVPPDRLKDIKVEMTIVDGKVVQSYKRRTE